MKTVGEREKYELFQRLGSSGHSVFIKVEDFQNEHRFNAICVFTTSEENGGFKLGKKYIFPAAMTTIDVDSVGPNYCIHCGNPLKEGYVRNDASL